MDATAIARESLFKNTGKIVSGSRFVGREDERYVLRQTVVGNRANVSIMGMPRVGKSSLAWHTLMENRQALAKEHKLICVYIDCSSISIKLDFYQLLISRLKREIRSLIKDGVTDLNDFYDNDLADIQATLDKDGLKYINDDFYSLFQILKEAEGFGAVYIFDEFDHAGRILDKADFLLLRETAYTPDTNLSYVTISRKALIEIEAKDADISNMHGTFNTYIYLNMFNDADMAVYWNRIRNAGLVIPDKKRAEIEYIAGNHPIFLDICCLQYFDTPNADMLSIPSLRQKLYDEYNQIIEMLEGKKMLDIVKQIVIGPLYEVSNIKLNYLLDFGFIKETTQAHKAEMLSLPMPAGVSDKEKTYVLFSDFFTQLFYAKYSLDTAYWPVWGETENKLRELVEYFVINRYGVQWADVIEDDNVNDTRWLDTWDRMLERYEKNQRIYTNTKVSSVITYAETGEIYHQFIKRYWDLWFNRVFTAVLPNELTFSQTMAGTASSTWPNIFDFLMKIRRPYAHNNIQVLGKEDEVVAKGYCELIKKKIQQWEQAGKSKPAPYNGTASPASVSSVPVSSVSKSGTTGKLVEGKDFRGVIVEPTRYGDRKNKVQCDYYAYPLEIRGNCDELYPDDKVIFTAGKEPNANNPTRTYWYAYHVRLDE